MKLPWFKFYPADFLSGIAGLSAAEVGVYFTLLCMMYDQGGPIVHDERRLARRCALNGFNFRRVFETLLNTGKVFIDAQGRIANERVLSEQKRVIRQGGMRTKSALSRWDKHQQKQTPGDANALQVHTEARSQKSEGDTNVSPNRETIVSLVNEPAAPVVDLTRKRIERTQSDQVLLDQITDRWNAWAKPRGLAAVALLTATRGQQCRRRIAELQALTQTATPEEAFEHLLRRCEASFFIRGAPRSKLKFDQLMRESFMAQMVEGAFEHQGGNGRWRR